MYSRFFGKEAEKIAAKWETERPSREADAVEKTITQVFEDADVTGMVHEVECRSTLCRMRVDADMVRNDFEANKRLAGKLGVNGWMLKGETNDVFLSFVPMDYEPMAQTN